MITQAAEKWLANQPGWNLCKRVPEAALSYYKELAKEQNLDPEERLEVD